MKLPSVEKKPSIGILALLVETRHALAVGLSGFPPAFRRQIRGAGATILAIAAMGFSSPHVRAQSLGYTGAKTTVTLPAGAYTIIAAGAQGGGYQYGSGSGQVYAGGPGAVVTAKVSISPSSNITIAVGGAGSGGSYSGGPGGSGVGGGGGGATYIAGAGVALVAAGGGGAGAGGVGGGGMVQFSGSTTGGYPGYDAVAMVNGGQAGAGGGGYLGDGYSGAASYGGGSLGSGGQGGGTNIFNFSNGGAGGFGGGGSASSSDAGGGGGGYAGGTGGGVNSSAVGQPGMGGDSGFINATVVSAVPGANSGNGYVKILPQIVVASSDSVPGVSNASFSVVDNPAIDANGNVAFKATLKGAGVTAKDNAGIWLYTSGTGRLIARTGNPAAGLSGALYSTLSDPVFGSGGNLAFAGTLTGGDVSPAKGNSQGLWTASGSNVSLFLRSGSAVPSITGAKYKSFISLAPASSGLAFLATLTGVKPQAATALFGVDSTGNSQLAVQGDETFSTFLTGTVSSIAALAPASSLVRGQGDAVDGINGNLAFRVSFTNKTSALVAAAPATSSVSLSSVALSGPSGGGATGVANAVWTSFGLPAVNKTGTVAFHASIAGASTNKMITASNNSGIWSESGGSTTLVARTGAAAPGITNGLFSSLSDPVLNNAGLTAFIGTVRPAGKTITGSNDHGIWADFGAGAALVARTGDAAPVASGSAGNFSAFKSIVYPDTGGPIFVATVTGLKAPANVGVWSVDGSGVVHPVLKDGDNVSVMIDVFKKVKSFNIFTTPPTVSAGVRNFAAADRSYVCLASFTDNSWAILEGVAP